MKNGHLSASETLKSYTEFVQFEAATGGQVSASALKRIAQTGGFALQGVPLAASLAGLAATILELGPRAGTGIGAAAFQLEGGNASLKTVTGMERYGLIGKGGYSHKDGHYSVNPGALYKSHDLATKGLAYWVSKDLVPKLHSEGVHTAPQMIAALSQILGSIRAARFVMTLATPTGREQSARDQALVKQAFHSHPYAASQTTLAQNLTNIDAAFSTLFETLGEPLVPKAVYVLKHVTDAVLYFDKLATLHPKVAEGVTIGLLGTGITAGGLAIVKLTGRVSRFFTAFGGPEAAATAATLETLGGAAAVAGSFLSFASGLGEIAAAVKYAELIFHGWGHPGSIAPPLNVRRMPGFGPGGHTDVPNLDNLVPHNQSYIPPAHGGVRVQHVTYVQLDRKTIAKAVSEDMAQGMSLPSSGPTRFDGRMTPSFPQHTLPI